MADINAACLAAANALQALSNLQPGFASNISPRLTVAENQRRQTRNTCSSEDEGESRNTRSTGQTEQTLQNQTNRQQQQNSSIQSRLQSCFPTIASRPPTGRNPVRNGRVSKRSKARHTGTSIPGRPKKTIVYKDLVILPGPDIDKVPTHNSRVKLEERQLVCHEFPFKKEWDEATLKNEIFKQFPQLISFVFVKPCYGKIVKPMLAEGVQFHCERVIKMAGQGAVYIRSNFPLTDEDEDDELCQCALQISETENTDSQTNTVSNSSAIHECSEGMSPPHFNGDGILDVLSVVEEGESNCSVTLDSITGGREFSDAMDPCDEILMGVVQSRSDQVIPSLHPENVMNVPSFSVVGNEGDDNELLEVTQTFQEQKQQVIKIHRLNVKQDVIDAFKDPVIMDRDVTFVFIDSRGHEEKGSGIGVVRDALSLFWKEVYDSLLIGEKERVPYIRHDYSRRDWEAVASVLLKGYRMCQYIPLLISKTFLSYVLFGESSLSEPGILMQSFMQYISAEETKILQKSLSGDLDFQNEEEFNELLDVLKNYDCRARVTQENIEVVIQEIAHKEIIQKPQYVTNCWKDILQPLKGTFPTPNSLADMYEQIKPSASKITKCIQSFPQSDAERECLGYLRRYIRGLDTPEKLATFVRFISGSELMLFEGIQVTFTDLCGLERRPIARTCNSLLQLPSSYQSFPELREEFNHILMADNWEIDIV